MEKATSDKELLERLQQKDPEILKAEVDFDVPIIQILKTKTKPNKTSLTLRTSQKRQRKNPQK